MKRKLTPEQTAKRDERRAKFKTLWKAVADMPELERVQMSNRLGFVTCEGHAFSPCNSMLLAMQCPAGSVFGGFRQWLKHGRAVRKGEHGAMIWVPCGIRAAAEAPAVEGEAATESAERSGFIIGTVFDIGQTNEIESEPAVLAEVLEFEGAPA